MPRLDLKKELKRLYMPSAKEVVIVDVPEMNFLMIDGTGRPQDSPQFQEAIAALYGVAYTMKFMLKKAGEKTPDSVVMPLEGLWWTDDETGAFDSDASKDSWKWTLMIMQPHFIAQAHISEAAEELRKKKHTPALPRLRFEALHEGPAVQIMHIGPYSEEQLTIKRMRDFAAENGYGFHGKHHEIYLSDPRRTAPEKLKTVLRQPIKTI